MPPRDASKADRGQECVLMTDGEWEHFWSQHDARQDVKHDANLNQHPPESDEPGSASSDEGEQGVREEEERGRHQPQAMSQKMIQTSSAAIARKAQRSNRCGACRASRSSDCGGCKNCLDKPR